MHGVWEKNTSSLNTEAEVFRVLADLRGKRWLLRGHSRQRGGLVPSIDRNGREGLSRGQKLVIERRSIDLFRSTARFFAAPGEEEALHNDLTALMVLRHYGVATRLLDWSSSPWIAAYFAVHGDDRETGEIWAFDEPLYEDLGKKQWDAWGGEWPWWTAFSLDDPIPWFVCQFYRHRFPRLEAQQGAFTMTPQFGVDHATAIAQLLVDHPEAYHLYTVPAALKPILRQDLREKHGIWRGSLFPDSAGAADTVCEEIPEMRV